MRTSQMYRRDTFMKEILISNKIEYDDRSLISEHIDWGINEGYFYIEENDPPKNKEYQHSVSIILNEKGKTYIEFLLL